MKKTDKVFISLLLLVVLFMNTTGCSRISGTDTINNTDDSPERNTMEYSKVSETKAIESTDDFVESMADFSLELFKKSIDDKENSLVSPLSVSLALSMTANGASGETLKQMEAVLGRSISIDELNEYLYNYVQGLPSEEKSKLGIANSIWLRDDGSLVIEPDFLQKNTEYYGASVNSSAFDSQTLKDINDWVSINTDGMIDKVLDQIDKDAMLYLINAVVFDAEWQSVYNIAEIRDGEFIDIGGKTQSVEFMYSKEHIYLDDGKATGFIKPYAGGAYSFMALLPNEDISLQDYIESLDGPGFLSLLDNPEYTLVNASMPKYKFEYEISMNDILADLGMPDAFEDNKADFRRMGASTSGSLYIQEVLHKTYISVDELGTKAGAVTEVMMVPLNAPLETPKVVNLDRPFVFAIVDNSTNLPIFIGTVMTIE